jgi:hypothetical protein
VGSLSGLIYLIIYQEEQTIKKVESTYVYDGLCKERNNISKRRHLISPRNHLYNCPTVPHVPVRKGIDWLNQLQQKATLNNRVAARF